MPDLSELPDPSTVGVVARFLKVNPATITDLFYKGQLRDDVCPIVGRCRLIPRHYVPMIVWALRRKGIRVAWNGNAGKEGQPKR